MYLIKIIKEDFVLFALRQSDSISQAIYCVNKPKRSNGKYYPNSFCQRLLNNVRVNNKIKAAITQDGLLPFRFEMSRSFFSGKMGTLESPSYLYQREGNVTTLSLAALSAWFYDYYLPLMFHILI